MSQASDSRLSLGIPGLDERLGGGLLPGTLTVVVGATGIGKTQMGLQFAHTGTRQEGRNGIILDMTARGDSQSHREYAQRMFGWSLREAAPDRREPRADVFDTQHPTADYLRVFGYQGRRVTRRDLDVDQWHDWQAELVSRLTLTIAFFYANFLRGARRTVIDGIEPVDRPSESIQFHLVEYIYHQILRKEHDWVARDFFREEFAAQAENVSRHAYDHRDVACVLLYTSREVLLEELISRPLDEGDVLSNANTIIYLGKVRDGGRMRRALHIAKHRGSACDDGITLFEIGEQGISVAT